MILNQTLLQDIKKLFESVNLDIKINLILTGSQFNSTKVNQVIICALKPGKYNEDTDKNRELLSIEKKKAISKTSQLSWWSRTSDLATQPYAL